MFAVLELPFGDEGLAALVAPSPPAQVRRRRRFERLTELYRHLNLSQTQVTDAGCATIYSASDSDVLPALVDLFLGKVLFFRT